MPVPGATARPSTPSVLAFTLPAEWVAPSLARERFDRWLGDLAWPGSQRADLVLALSEAVSNSVEHGYGIGSGQLPDEADVVEVHARVAVGPDDTRRVVLIVRDLGRWREPVAPQRHRGHGLSMIRAGGDELRIDGDDDGTTVTLTSRPAPPSPASGAKP